MSARRTLRRLRRATRIGWVAVRFRLDMVLQEAGLPLDQLPWTLRLLLALNPLRLLPRPRTTVAWRLRHALESLGPVFVKFGQILSTRRDLLAPDFAEELRQLQDRVTPFSGTEARVIAERALGTPLSEAFASFDAEPLAAASVAQVHGATLLDGTRVVVKIIRPGIDVVIAEDIELLYGFAELLERFWRDARRLHPVDIVRDYERTIGDELDLLHEAANTAQLRRNFTGSELLYVPRIYWQFTRRNVMVMERIDGVPISDLDRLHAAGTDMRVLAERGVETFFTQVFEDNFFHADMHPGNIFIDISDPADPSYIAIDCAIIGRLTENDQDYLARNILAFFHQNYHEVARLHVESGWVPPHTDVHEFERVIRAVCEPIFQKPLKDISFGHLLITLFQTARRFEMEVQPQLVLLQKTLLNIEGLGRQLYPELDLWHTAKPFMERWMARRTGPLAVIRSLADQLPELLESLPQLPRRLIDSERRERQLDTLVSQQRLQQQQLEQLHERARRQSRQLRLAGLAATVGGLLLALLASQQPTAASLLAAGATLGAGLILLLQA